MASSSAEGGNALNAVGDLRIMRGSERSTVLLVVKKTVEEKL